MKKKIPKKNYIIVFAIAIATVGFVLYLASWYNTSQEYKKNNSVLSGFLSEIKAEEIDSYLLENPEVVIYAASSKDETIKSFEKEFKKILDDEEVKSHVLYINVSLEENNKLLKVIKEKNEKEMDSLIVPNLVYFENGKVKSIMYSKQKEITKRDAYNFLIKNGIITND